VAAAILVGLVVWAVAGGRLLRRPQLILLATLFPSVILHEISHGVVALVFGDDTARRAGRLSLNPLRHVDPFGTVILPAMLLLAGAPAFGYAKPVPVNVGALRHPRNHGLLVSLVGPSTNLALVAIATVVYRVGRPVGTVREVVLDFGAVNVLLALFNLLPLPPLDGSAVVERLLPARWWPGWLSFRRYSMAILLLVVLALPARWSLGRIISPGIDFWYDTFVR
jgi:Zn-dependent protease